MANVGSETRSSRKNRKFPLFRANISRERDSALICTDRVLRDRQNGDWGEEPQGTLSSEFSVSHVPRGSKRPSRLLRAEAPRNGGPGGGKDARETIGFSTRFLIATWNCAGLPNLIMVNCKEMEFTTPDSIFGDVPDLDSRKEAEIGKDREKWNSLRPQSVSNLFMGKCRKKVTCRFGGRIF